MQESTFAMVASEGTRIHVYRWLPDPECNVKGVVQIAHGMGETGPDTQNLPTSLPKMAMRFMPMTIGVMAKLWRMPSCLVMLVSMPSAGWRVI